MTKNLDHLIDRGCWISDDRVYAFVSADGNIGELGYHGTQPVSRNARILVREGGVVSFAYVGSDGTEHPIDFRNVDWEASEISKTIAFSSGTLVLRIRASGRSVIVNGSGTVSDPVELVVRVSKSSEYHNVQGERIWEPPQVNEGLMLHCRDRITLHSWLGRTGPYAGDFLIPEPVRRQIFVGQKRSGTATIADLRPAFREKDLVLYDAHIFVGISGEGFSVTAENDVWVFRKRIGDYPGTLRIRFADDRGSLSGTDDTAEVKKGRPCAPTLKLEMFPAWEEFIATVPDIVHSCRIHDLGVLRATPGRYYWIWAWDMLVSVHEAMRWGDVGLCRDTIRFVNEHRDANGRIPARWTRSLLPLDTPSPGGIEFLFAAVTHLVVHETGDRALLADVFPAMVASLRAVAPSLKAEGMVRGEGFYPDLLTSFGRKPESAVSMETGSWFVYCVIMEDLASLLDDRAVAEEARVCKKSVAAQFLARFEDKDFLVDAIDPETGKNNGKHPLFSLLFLHTTEGFELVGSKIGEMADAIEQRFLSEHGMRIMPIGEGEGEVVLDSWYPHWDLYAIRVLRRAGRRDAIMKWLKLSERVLSTLGYCPEFLEQSGFRTGDPGAWERHGAASNLNCVTGWYRALREAVFGIEITGSYITHFPLSLPLGTAVLEGIRWKEGEWRFTIDYSGPHLKAIIVDGEEIQGLVIPGAHGTPGQHHVTIRYGDN